MTWLAYRLVCSTMRLTRVVVKKSLKTSTIRAEMGTVGPTSPVNGSTVTLCVLSLHCSCMPASLPRHPRLLPLPLPLPRPRPRPLPLPLPLPRPRPRPRPRLQDRTLSD